MLIKLLTVLAIMGAAYWYWSGPYQVNLQPDYQDRLQQNNNNMNLCLHGENYRQGATGTVGSPEQFCAQKFNLYQLDGQWHSYDDIRRED